MSSEETSTVFCPNCGRAYDVAVGAARARARCKCGCKFNLATGEVIDQKAPAAGSGPVRVFKGTRAHRPGVEEPAAAFVAVHEQGYWFYIDQRDRMTKRTFSFLQLLLSLAETATPDRSPLITISN